MKKLLRLSVFALAAMFVFSSCNKDDDDNGNGNGNGNGGNNNTSGELTIDGKKFDLKSGLIEDYDSDGTHYNWDFTLVNTQYRQVTDSFDTYYEPDSVGLTALVYFELFSAGTDEFKPGTFNYAMGSSGNYFEYAEFYLDLKGDGMIDYFSDNEYLEVTEGTVTVTKNSETNYKIEFNVKAMDFEGNSMDVSGMYSGSFFMD